MAGEVNSKTSIKQLFQGLAGEGVEVLQGIVKSANPLKIQIVNDDKLVIGANSTYVPRHLTNYATKVDIVQGSGTVDGSTETEDAIKTLNIYGATMTVNNALQIGETVHVLSFNHGKQYYVLDRVN